MFHACWSAVPQWRSVFAIALGALAGGCSAASGSGGAEPAEASNSGAPVLRTANTQQTFGSGGAASSSAGAASSSAAAPSPASTSAPPVSPAPVQSSEAQKDPILVSPDAGVNGSPPPANRPSPSAEPPPSKDPGAQSDDDDDDDDHDDDDD